jgi:DHA2 family methylenomycin A resistance protein-like MFS transporter
MRLPLAFTLIVAAYAGALCLVYRYVKLVKPV